MTRKFSLEPAATVIRVIGGVAVAADITGTDRTTVWRWTQPKPKGTGGLVPAEHQGPLLRWAIEHGKPLTPAMFFVLKLKSSRRCSVASSSVQRVARVER